jgi:polyphosphate glucokinase
MEFGHVEVGGKNAESWASDAAREREDLKWEKWGKRVDRVLHTIEDLVWPDLFIVGGGVSKKSEKFFPQFTLRTPIVTANFLNDAGIVGAALHAK